MNKLTEIESTLNNAIHFLSREDLSEKGWQIHTELIEARNKVENLVLSSVVKSLPTKTEAMPIIDELRQQMRNEEKSENHIKSYLLGFKHCFNWMLKELKK